MSSSIVAASTRPYSGFDPRSIGSCVLWLDAADASKYSLTGGNLSTWTDKSSNGYSCAPVSGNTISTATQNGLNVFYMNSVRATIPNFVWSNQHTFLAVIRVVTGGFLYSQHTASGYINYILTSNWDLIDINLTNGGIRLRDSVNALGASVIPINAYSIFTIGYDSGTSASNYAVNGSTRSTQLVLGGAQSPGSNTSTLWISGNSSSASDPTYVAEIIQYNTSISTSDRQQLEGYLAWKWGLRSNLPATHPFRNVPPYTRSLLPIDITPTLWLDAADVSTMTLSGSNVTQWNDKSGNGRNASNLQTGALLTTNVQNGLPVLRFNGSTNNYSVSYSSFPRTAYTIFTVQFLSDSSSTYRRVIHGGTSTNDQFLFVGVVGQNVATFTGNGSSWNDLNANTPNSNNLNLWRIVTTWVSGSTLTPYVDGTAQNNKTGTTAAFNNLTIGLSSASGNQRWFGDMGEIIIFSSALSTSQRQQVEGYLAHKWRLVGNLPSTHPFKLYPPLQVAFTPVQVSGCQLWLDAADSSTMTLSGSNVTQWNDKSGNGRNAIGNIGTGTYSSTGLNSLPTVQITPTGNMVSSIPAGRFSNGIVVFVVFQKTGANNTADTIVTRTATNSIPSPFDIYGGINQPTVTIRIVGDGTNYRSGSDNPNSVTRLTSPTIWSVSIFSTTPANWIESVNGTSRTLTLSSLSGNGNYGDNANFFYIGTRGDNFTKMTGNISEIIAYNASLFSTEQRQQVEGYLAHKWGLTSSLPATHPFKKIRP